MYLYKIMNFDEYANRFIACTECDRVVLLRIRIALINANTDYMARMPRVTPTVCYECKTMTGNDTTNNRTATGKIGYLSKNIFESWFVFKKLMACANEPTGVTVSEDVVSIMDRSYIMRMMPKGCEMVSVNVLNNQYSTVFCYDHLKIGFF